MKKSLITLTIMLAAVAMIAVFSCPATAQVTGQCSNCHTMHNSQGGTEMAAAGGPYGALVMNTCAGCHTTNGTDPLDDANGYPYVKSSGTFANYLAGGYFTDGGASHDDMSHTLTSTHLPVGYDTGFSTNGDWYTGDTTGLTCAGSAGCHGLETEPDEAKAISGGHHGNNTVLGWRMLTVGTLPLLGQDTYMTESDPKDYEEALNYAVTPTGDEFHNLYSGGSVVGTVSSISKLCGKCHGDFHSDTQNAQSAWIRHPTDVALPDDWEIPSVADSYTANDYKNNPVGTPTAILPLANGGANSVYATCLSCHRAHGSAADDILRWNYATQDAGSGTAYGCLGCHNKQR